MRHLVCCVCVRLFSPSTADERPTNHYQTADGPWTEDGPQSLKPANGCKSNIDGAVKTWKNRKINVHPLTSAVSELIVTHTVNGPQLASRMQENVSALGRSFSECCVNFLIVLDLPWKRVCVCVCVCVCVQLCPWLPDSTSNVVTMCVCVS